MSSRFVFSEEVDIQEQEQKKEEEKNSSNALDKSNDKDRDDQTRDSTITDDKERKSLLQQLHANRQRRYKEHKKKMESQNSSYKMKKDTIEFYQMLDKTKEARKLKEKQEEEEGLRLIRERKNKKKSFTINPVTVTSMLDTNMSQSITLKKKQKKTSAYTGNKDTKAKSLVFYTDSESE